MKTLSKQNNLGKKTMSIPSICDLSRTSSCRTEVVFCMKGEKCITMMEAVCKAWLHICNMTMLKIILDCIFLSSRNCFDWFVFDWDFLIIWLTAHNDTFTFSTFSQQSPFSSMCALTGLNRLIMPLGQREFFRDAANVYTRESVISFMHKRFFSWFYYFAGLI